MMPLSTQDAQVLKLINTPKLPASLFQGAQPLPVTVISTQGSLATILLAGRTLEAQTAIPLTPGQRLSAQPELQEDGQLRLRLLPQPQPGATPTSSQNTTPQPPPGQLPTNPQPLNTGSGNNSAANVAPLPLPDTAKALPAALQQTLSNLRTSLPAQQPLQQVLQQLTDLFPQLGQKTAQPETTDKNSSAWQSLARHALPVTPPPSPEQIQKTLTHFNSVLRTSKTPADWQQAMQQLISDPRIADDEKQLARSLLARSDTTEQIQSLLHASGQPVLLQELPLTWQGQMHGLTLEVELPKPDTPEEDRIWRIFLQLQLEDGDFSCQLQLNHQQEARLQLWGSSEPLSSAIHAQIPQLRQALTEQGIHIESLIVATGKPASRIEQRPWRSPLVDTHG